MRRANEAALAKDYTYSYAARQTSAEPTGALEACVALAASRTARADVRETRRISDAASAVQALCECPIKAAEAHRRCVPRSAAASTASIVREMWRGLLQRFFAVPSRKHGAGFLRHSGQALLGRREL
jgi:hypothetical protein